MIILVSNRFRNYSTGSGDTRVTLHFYVPALVLTVTTRVLPSLPEKASIICPRGQCNDGVLSSFNSTDPNLFWFLHRIVSWLKYSFNHLLQKWPFIDCVCSHEDSLFVGMSLLSSSGKFVRDSSIKKCAEERTWSSVGSWKIGVMGRKLKVASISIV
jgi:hypothetical protein